MSPDTYADATSWPTFEPVISLADVQNESADGYRPSLTDARPFGAWCARILPRHHWPIHRFARDMNRDRVARRR